MDRIAMTEFLAAALLWAAVPAWAGEEGSPKESEGIFSLTAKADRAEGEVGTTFRLDAAVKNLTDGKAAFKVLSVTYAAHFVTTSPFLRIVIPPADKNFPKEVELEAGASWEVPLDVTVLDGAPETLSFVLGFNPTVFDQTVWLAASLSIRVPGGAAAPPPLPFEIAADAGDHEVEPGEEFEMKLSVKNTSPGVQAFTIHSHSWGAEWLCTNPRFGFKVPQSRRGILKEITLKPGESWEGVLKGWVDKKTPAGTLAYRMAFRSLGSSTIHLSPERILKVRD